MSRRSQIIIPPSQPLPRPDPPRSGTSLLGLALIGMGATGLVIRLLTKRGGFLALFASCAAISVGFSLSATRAVKDREAHVHDVQTVVSQELDRLDPVGRAQVIAAVAGGEARRYSVRGWWGR